MPLEEARALGFQPGVHSLVPGATKTHLLCDCVSPRLTSCSSLHELAVFSQHDPVVPAHPSHRISVFEQGLCLDSQLLYASLSLKKLQCECLL